MLYASCCWLLVVGLLSVICGFLFVVVIVVVVAVAVHSCSCNTSCLMFFVCFWMFFVVAAVTAVAAVVAVTDVLSVSFPHLILHLILSQSLKLIKKSCRSFFQFNPF